MPKHGHFVVRVPKGEMFDNELYATQFGTSLGRTYDPGARSRFKSDQRPQAHSPILRFHPHCVLYPRLGDLPGSGRLVIDFDGT
jgi:hypothetical protein